MVLFLNGILIFTAELKSPLTGQNVEDAIRQYRFNRDPKEPLFAFGRCLAHFAVDSDLVYMTTRLQGSKTVFLPFNQGRNGGAGNPPSWTDFATAYLWQRIWARDSVLNLIQYFIHIVEEEDDEGRKTGKLNLIFPRYHQLDSVRRLVSDARIDGTGQRYLIQHSAGSGKSSSMIVDEISDLPGKRFAVVIDEAHSSQSGESTKSLKAVLAAGSLEEAEEEEGGDYGRSLCRTRGIPNWRKSKSDDRHTLPAPRSLL